MHFFLGFLLIIIIIQNKSYFKKISIYTNRKNTYIYIFYFFQFVGSRQKQMIINLYKTKIEEQPNIKYKPLIAYLLKATGIGRDTICNTIRDYKKHKQLKSPNKKKIVQHSMKKLMTSTKTL